jgi:hypothetical protein
MDAQVENRHRCAGDSVLLLIGDVNRELVRRLTAK